MAKLRHSDQQRARQILASGNFTAPPGQRGAEAEARSPPYQKKDFTFYYPGARPPPGQKIMEGGFETSKPGLTGGVGPTGPEQLNVPKTLDDYRLGLSKYVTVASPQSKLRQRIDLGDIEYRSPIDGKIYKLSNVPGYTHDRGSAFTEDKPDKRDIAVGDFRGINPDTGLPFTDASAHAFSVKHHKQFSPGTFAREIQQAQPYTGPEEGVGKGKRLDPISDQMAQKFGGDVSDIGWSSRIPMRELTRPESENIEERRDQAPFVYDPAQYKSHPGVEEFYQRGFKPVEPSFGVDWEKSIRENPTLREVEKIQAGPNRFDPRTGRALPGFEHLDKGRELDSATPTVNGNGKLNVDVNAPKGVSVKAEGEGLFNKTETNRQMEPMEAE